MAAFAIVVAEDIFGHVETSICIHAYLNETA